MNLPQNTTEWIKLTTAYQKPEVWKSWGQVLTSFGPFVLFWALAYHAYQESLWLMWPFALVASLFLVRIFIIQHDCGHGSFLKSKRWRDRLGIACSFFTMVPYEEWAYKHASHHTHLGEEEHLWTELGEIELLTVDEYLSRGKWPQRWYRLYRHPIFLFLIGPPLHFIVQNRFARAELKHRKDLNWSVYRTNLVLVILFVGLSAWLGWQAVLIIQLTIMYVSTVIAAWIFYIQHQFEERYVEESKHWDHAQAAIYGSSYFKLPAVLQWFTGSIGFHHVHHLNPTIPNYQLSACHEENPAFGQAVQTFTLLDCWQTMKLRFWDKKLKRMITYSELKARYLETATG